MTTANSLFTTRVCRFPSSQQEGKAYVLFYELEKEGRLHELTANVAKPLIEQYHKNKKTTPILSIYRAFDKSLQP